MTLFRHTPVLEFEKVATQDIGEDVTKWGRAILKELFVQCPEAAEFVPDVQMVRIDEEQGMALGVVNMMASTNDVAANSPTRVFIPFVVRGFQLSPLDLFMTRGGKLFPLNGPRLRQALFRPEVFEQVTQDWGSTSLHDLFYPPGREGNEPGSGIGGGGGDSVNRIFGNGMKMSSADFVMLSGLLPTLHAPDLQRFAASFDLEPGLLKVASENAAMMAGMQLLSSAEGGAATSAAPLVKKAMETAPTHVMQLGYSQGHQQYWVKRASRSVFYQDGLEFMSRGEFLKFAGEEVTSQVDTEGVVTITANKAAPQPAAMSNNAEVWKVVDAPGIYRVKTLEGKELTGWVIPDLIGTDGVRLPLSLFTNGSVAMVQDVIYGTLVGTGAELPANQPKGPGVFYLSGRGGLVAMEPMTVLGSEADMSGSTSYHVNTMDGEEKRITLVDGVQQLTPMDDTVFIPSNAHFLALNDETAVALVRGPNELTKVSSARSTVRVHGSGDGEYTFHFTGMPKLASQVPTRQDAHTAVFTLCLAGLDAQDAHNKLAASNYGPVTVAGEDVRLADDLFASTKVASMKSSAAITGLRRYLEKEAAVLPDALSVDSVLSLGFINSENIRLFTSRIPYLEKSLNHIGELLLGSRLGLVEISEPAAARCVRALDEVISGVKALAMRSTETEEG